MIARRFRVGPCKKIEVALSNGRRDDERTVVRAQLFDFRREGIRQLLSGFEDNDNVKSFSHF